MSSLIHTDWFSAFLCRSYDTQGDLTHVFTHFLIFELVCVCVHTLSVHMKGCKLQPNRWANFCRIWLRWIRGRAVLLISSGSWNSLTMKFEIFVCFKIWNLKSEETRLSGLPVLFLNYKKTTSDLSNFWHEMKTQIRSTVEDESIRCSTPMLTLG